MSSSTKAGEIKDLNLSLCIIRRQIKPDERAYKNGCLTACLEYFENLVKN